MSEKQPPTQDKEPRVANCKQCGSPNVSGGKCQNCGTQYEQPPAPSKWGPGGKMHEMVQFALKLDAQLDEMEQRAGGHMGAEASGNKRESGPTCSKGHPNRSIARFCATCGESLAGVTPGHNQQAEASSSAVCSHCSTQNRPGARFCKNCGTPLA